MKNKMNKHKQEYVFEGLDFTVEVIGTLYPEIDEKIKEMMSLFYIRKQNK